MRPPPRALAIFLLASSSFLYAQTAPTPPRGPDNFASTTIPGIEVTSYPNLPFSATDTIVRTRPVEGGGSVITSATSKVFRDSQGKVYRERHHLSPQDVDPEKTIYGFSILDPVARTRTTCMIATHQCDITHFYPQLAFQFRPTGPFDGGKKFLARESLGQKSIDDLPATGTRETTTISPEAIGNDQAITLIREFWYSPDLKTNLRVTRSDPREGTVAIHLQVLSRTEPDPSVFAVPPGYTLHDARPPVQLLQ
jgi:hypothetical protein